MVQFLQRYISSLAAILNRTAQIIPASCLPVIKPQRMWANPLPASAILPGISVPRMGIPAVRRNTLKNTIRQTVGRVR